MTFDDILGQVVALLKRQGRVSYGAIKRRFELADDYLDDIKIELVEAQRLAEDENGRILVWLGEGETTPVEPHMPDAERRQLTVMFCDLVGSTSLSGQLDPEALRDVIRAYQASCTEVIQRFEGYVAQHLGDGLLAYFGYPAAHEDDAQRAVRTGLGIIDAMQTLNQQLEPMHGIQLAVRMGIHTGLVVIGDIGTGERQEQLALGETPNIAARIEGIAAPDTVAISTETHRLVEGYFDFEVSGAYRLKGVPQPVTAYRVLQESDTQNRLDITAARGLTPLVGRESELSLLRDRWEQTKSGQGQVVFLSGESGIGKSRLTRTLREHASTASHHRLECRCSPYFQNTTLYPLLDLLERTLGFRRQDTPATKLQKLESTLRQSHLDIETTVPLLAFPLSIPLPGGQYPQLEMTPQRRKQRILETFIAMILELAEHEPILFILEDLHWVDATTIEFLDLLIEQVPTTSILAVLTCRPEFQPPWGLRSHLTPIALSRLPRSQIELMVQRLTDGKRLPDGVIQHLIEKTDGVPLYVEEMTKTLLESGHLNESDAGFKLTEPLHRLTIPATLQDSLMARLDKLDSAKGVAQLGATIGRQFSYDLLQALSPLSETILQCELKKLTDAELIYQRGVAPNSTYLFKHALIQDTAYESLLHSTRQEYHRRLAEVLADQYPETAKTQPELLAHHYTEANQIDQAIGYWQQAGQRASERSAYQEAISHLTTGLSLLQTLPETLERHHRELILQTSLGTAWLVAKGHAAHEVEATYTRARALCQQLGGTPDVFPILFGMWRFYVARPDFSLAQQLGEDLLGLAERHEESSFYIAAHYACGLNCFLLGNLNLAYSHLKEGIVRDHPHQHRSPLFRAGQDPGVACRMYAAWTRWFSGYPDQALAHVQDALTLATEIAHPYSYAFALNIASSVWLFRGEWQNVYDHAETAITLSTEQGFTLWLAFGTWLQGSALMAQGQREEGLRQMRQGSMAWRGSGAETGAPYLLALLAEGYSILNQVEAGLNSLKEGFEITERTGERFCQAELHRLNGQLLLAQSSNNAAKAEACYDQALDISRQQQAKSLELRAAISLARLWQRQGKRDDAQQLLAPVYDWFTEGFDTADLIEAKALLNELEGPQS